jgi:hypothetical protein
MRSTLYLAVASGSWRSQRLSLGGYVTGTEAKAGATAAEGVHGVYALCVIYARKKEGLPCALRSHPPFC